MAVLDDEFEEERRQRQRDLRTQLEPDYAAPEPLPPPPAPESNNGGAPGGGGPSPAPAPPSGGGNSGGGGGGGRSPSRDEALRRVQAAYQQYLPHQMGEVGGAVDEVLGRASGYSGYTFDRAFGDLVAQLQQRAGNAPGGSSGGGGGYRPSGGEGDAALSNFLQYLQQQQQARDAERAQMRQMLVGQINGLQGPVDANAPGIKEIITGQRLALDRGASRQRQDAAESRAYDGSGGVGGKAFTTDSRRIAETRAVNEAQLTGEVLNREHTRRAQQLTQLLSLAMQLGDTSAAQAIQQQLNAIQTQLGQSNFYDQMGFNYAGMNQNANLQALLALLNSA